ncbi:2,3-bisphosphoglycerate-independent phosphoglycerate mutase [Candidatus Microgenomates bacterium]|nr:2,3-bisphosphoglycerate-independent phosphoglycerate mutase [Candidatus Microgenomates bacterium]
MSKKLAQFVTLIVLDGWGVDEPGAGNAITSANPPNFNRFWSAYPHTTLSASGEAVGLPRGEPGNTETGHLNLGAGRIIYQDLPRINFSIANGSFFKNPVLLGAVSHAKENNSNLHLMGLVGEGGVHSNAEHLFALLRLAKNEDFNRVFVHAFTDGRDSPPTSAPNYIKSLEEEMGSQGLGKIASIQGRYWAMDRDSRWDRTAKAYLALTQGAGNKAISATQAIEISYKNSRTDEFIEPTIIIDDSGQPISKIGDNDAVIFFNFRVDRPRQLTKAFVLPDFETQAQKEWDFDPYMVKYYKKHLAEIPQRPVFKRGKQLQNLYFVTMTEYQKSLPVRVAFPPEVVGVSLGRVLSDNGIRQLRVTESEKERFVGFYFNGQQEQKFDGEERLIIPSPNVATYDQKPEMAAFEITNAVISEIKSISQPYGFILVNFANADMVGHTGNVGAAMKACLAVDQSIGQIVETVESIGGAVLITADHGNAEQMIDDKGKPRTEHSTNPVPFIACGKTFLGLNKNPLAGILADVAPTILYILGIAKPVEMSGRNLLS